MSDTSLARTISVPSSFFAETADLNKTVRQNVINLFTENYDEKFHTNADQIINIIYDLLGLKIHNFNYNKISSNDPNYRKIYYNEGKKPKQNFKILETDNIKKIIQFITNGEFNKKINEENITLNTGLLDKYKNISDDLTYYKNMESINTNDLYQVLKLFIDMHIDNIEIYNIFSQHILKKPAPAPGSAPVPGSAPAPVPAPVPGSNTLGSGSNTPGPPTTTQQPQKQQQQHQQTTPTLISPPSNTPLSNTPPPTTTTTTQEKSAGFFEVYADDQGNLQVKNIVLHMGTELYSYAIDKNSEQKDDIRSDLAGKFIEQLNKGSLLSN